MERARKTTLKIQESLSPKVVTNIAKRYISLTKESIQKNNIFKEKHANAQLTTHVRTSVVDGVPASRSTKRQVKDGTSPTRTSQQHSALAAQNCTAQKHNSACRSAPIVVSSGKGTGNTNQYTQHKRQVFLVRGLRDKRENHVTSGIGLVSPSRVSPVYNQEREN